MIHCPRCGFYLKTLIPEPRPAREYKILCKNCGVIALVKLEYTTVGDRFFYELRVRTVWRGGKF